MGVVLIEVRDIHMLFRRIWANQVDNTKNYKGDTEQFYQYDHNLASFQTKTNPLRLEGWF